MTTPNERMRNLVQAGAFLKGVRAQKALPTQLRDEANRLPRHYPTPAELQMLAMTCDMLTPEIDPGWLIESRFGNGR